MTSVLTNSGAMIALLSLTATQTALTQTQNQISTGLSIGNAKDNAAAWTVATTMRANVASLQQVSGNLGHAASILGVAVNGATQITSLVSQIRAQVVSFTDPATNQTAVQDAVTQLASQIDAVVGASSFNGINLLDGSQSAGLTFVAATNNTYVNGGSSPTIQTAASVNLGSSNSGNATVQAFTTLLSNLQSAIDPVVVPASPGVPGSPGPPPVLGIPPTPAVYATQAQEATYLDTALQTIDSYNALVESQASSFGSTLANVDSQQNFVQSLASTVTTGAGAMVDADLSSLSARLTALQTQQSLGLQALSIANQAPQSILQLFNA